MQVLLEPPRQVGEGPEAPDDTYWKMSPKLCMQTCFNGFILRQCSCTRTTMCVQDRVSQVRISVQYHEVVNAAYSLLSFV